LVRKRLLSRKVKKMIVRSQPNNIYGHPYVINTTVEYIRPLKKERVRVIEPSNNANRYDPNGSKKSNGLILDIEV
jgi:hypothetical protein